MDERQNESGMPEFSLEDLMADAEGDYTASPDLSEMPKMPEMPDPRTETPEFSDAGNPWSRPEELQEDEPDDWPMMMTGTPAPEEPARAMPTDGAFEPDFGRAFDGYGQYDEAQLWQTEQPEEAPMRRRHHIKKFKFPALIKLAIYFAVVVLVAVILAKVGWSLADDVLALSRPDIDVEVTINQTDTLDDIAAKLKDAGAIKYEWLFKFYCKFTEKEDYFDPGVYTVNLTCDYSALVNHLMATAGNRETVKIMVIEGATCAEIFDLLEANNVCTRAALEQCAANYEFEYGFLRYLPYGDKNRLEGYLFPDTYEFYLMDDPEKVLDRFLKNYSKRFDDDLLEQLDANPYTMHQVLTLASIIEGEAANDEERPLIASVMFNRLNNWENPLLGMDSTVYYAAEQMGKEFDTALDSPYNTYLYPGIPKGPINNPGLNSIRAVLNPADTNYYYFATGVDGLNHFFTTESDFLAFLASDQFQQP